MIMEDKYFMTNPMVNYAMKQCCCKRKNMKEYYCIIKI